MSGWVYGTHAIMPSNHMLDIRWRGDHNADTTTREDMMPKPQSKLERFDPFKAEQDQNYSVDTFYTASTDEKGHVGGQIRFSLSPVMMGKMKQMIQDDTLPYYDTLEAIVRDSLVHRMVQIGNRKPDLMMDEVLASVRGASTLAAAMAMMDQEDSLVENTRITLERMQRDRPARLQSTCDSLLMDAAEMSTDLSRRVREVVEIFHDPEE